MWWLTSPKLNSYTPYQVKLRYAYYFHSEYFFMIIVIFITVYIFCLFSPVCMDNFDQMNCSVPAWPQTCHDIIMMSNTFSKLGTDVICFSTASWLKQRTDFWNCNPVHKKLAHGTFIPYLEKKLMKRTHLHVHVLLFILTFNHCHKSVLYQ